MSVCIGCQGLSHFQQVELTREERRAQRRAQLAALKKKAFSEPAPAPAPKQVARAVLISCSNSIHARFAARQEPEPKPKEESGAPPTEVITKAEDGQKAEAKEAGQDLEFDMFSDSINKLAPKIEGKGDGKPLTTVLPPS